MTQEERWNIRYNEVMAFIETNHRNPSRHRIEEHNMLNWLKANRKAMNAGKLKEDVVLEFFYHCFHQVHDGLADSVVSERIWNRVYRYSGSVSFFQEWDRCLKLKKGIVTHLKDVGFGRDVFEKFTPNEKINESLVSIFDKMK